MIPKLFEIRDIATFIPVLAVKLNPENEAEIYLLGRSGFGVCPQDQGKYVYLIRIDGGYGSNYDPFSWTDIQFILELNICRTMHHAHLYIEENFDNLESGAVIDIEFILGETDSPKESEGALHDKRIFSE